MRREVIRLDFSRTPDFYELHCDGNGAGWCRCVAWWVPTWEGWGDRTAEQNRALRDELFEAGWYDGYLLYVDGAPAGWCQVGPRDRLEKLAKQLSLPPDPDAWAITCFFVTPGRRRQGHASFMLREVLQDLKERGVTRLEAFPKRPEPGQPGGLDEGDLWNGPEPLYREAGFAVVRDDPTRPVLSLDLAPTEPGAPA